MCWLDLEPIHQGQGKNKSQFDLSCKDTTPKNSAVAHLFLQCTGSVMEMHILRVKPVKQNNPTDKVA